jgi:Ca2+-binding RTX toxin-like protein
MANVYGTVFNDNNTFNGFPYRYRRALYGTNSADNMYGYSGNDLMYGYGGNDRMYGGTGADTMYGGSGNDIYYVDNAGDRVVESYSGSFGGTDTVYSSISHSLSNNVENLRLLGSSSIYGYGNQLNNLIVGNSGNNYLYGAAGNDSIYGYAGRDTLSGGDGNDYLNGGTSNDYLVGGNGNDYLVGYGGTTGEVDTLSGGRGSDRFALGDSSRVYYADPGFDYAIIKDFTYNAWTGERDKIQVKGSIGDYTLKKTANWLGGSALDTAIYYKNGNLVGIVQDTTNVFASRDFVTV